MVKQLLRPIKYWLREGRFLKNINKRTAGNPRVLISYTVIPFLSNKKSHTNQQESRVIADLFDQLGYQVDVIHYTNLKKLNYREYDVIFGFGEPFENSFRDSRCKAKRIYYATGAHVFHQNPAEARRVVEFNAKYGANLLPQRLVPWCWTQSTTFSDYLIVIGNDWTESTYKSFTDKPILPINATALVNKNSVNIQRNLSNARKNFLWFGSAGLVHKGLDLCLEYFSSHPEYNLHVCGPQESEFFRVMQSELQKPNIVYHGFVDVMSEKFIEITSRCLFAILPSCSEGQATALLTAMGTGLIPIGSRYTGINIEQLGYRINSLDLDMIDETIKTAQAQTDEALIVQSAAILEYINKKHTIEYYKYQFNNILQYIIK